MWGIGFKGLKDKQDFLLRANLFEQFPHLFGRCQSRFIDHIEMLANHEETVLAQVLCLRSLTSAALPISY